jgi:glutathione S-transferase
VRHGLHAVSVDEQRASFTPTLWEADERIVQVLFPGAHADVGGGYPQSESGLSDCALQWVVDELVKLGVAFAPNPTVPLEPDACGMAHAPWAQAPWNLLPRGQRGLPAGLAVHRSVLDRLAGADRLRGAGLVPYEPESLAAYLSGGRVKPGVRIIG